MGAAVGLFHLVLPLLCPCIRLPPLLLLGGCLLLRLQYLCLCLRFRFCETSGVLRSQPPALMQTPFPECALELWRRNQPVCLPAGTPDVRWLALAVLVLLLARPRRSSRSQDGRWCVWRAWL